MTPEDQQARQVRYATIAVCLIAPFAMWMYLALGMPGNASVMGLGAIAGLLNLAALGRAVHPRIGAHIAISILYVVLFASNLATGGYYHPAFAWLYVIPMLAAATLDVRGTWAWIGIILATTVAFWTLPEVGISVVEAVPAEYGPAHALFNRVSAILALGLVATSFQVLQRQAKRELEHANGELSRETRYVRLLQEAAIAANESGSLEEAMQRSVARICTAMDWPAGHFLSVREDGNLHSAQLWQGRGWSTDLQELAGSTHAPGEGLPGRAMQRRRPEWVPDLQEFGTGRAARASELGLRSSVAVPVLANGEVVAVLEFGCSERLEVDARFEEVLAAIGIQLGRVFERAALEGRLRQSQKMEAVGRLAAGLAHEINNPMAYVRSNLSQLDRQWDTTADRIEKLEGLDPALIDALHDCHDLIHESVEGVERTISIVRDVKEFSHIASTEFVEADLVEVLESSIRVATPRIPPGLRIERDFAPVPRLRCRANQLQQVFVNLIVNAIQAVDARGSIRITLEHERDELCVSVEDDGPGIPEAHRERLFEPFFTSKAVGEGTGLGLYVSYEIVSSHDGRIEVHSEPGCGARFEVRLPLEPDRTRA